MAIVSRLHDGAAWPNWQKGHSREEVIRRPFSSDRSSIATSKRDDHLSLREDRSKNENSLGFMEK